MRKKRKLGHDPFKDEGPLSFIRDSRAGKLGKFDNIGNTTIPVRARKTRGRPKGTGATDRNVWTRATFIVRRDRLEKMKAVAYWERQTLKQVLDSALKSHLRGRAIKSIPKE